MVHGQSFPMINGVMQGTFILGFILMVLCNLCYFVTSPDSEVLEFWEAMTYQEESQDEDDNNIQETTIDNNI